MRLIIEARLTDEGNFVPLPRMTFFNKRPERFLIAEA